MHATAVYTVGHSTRSANELLMVLRDADVKLVADVRAFPSSRRHPQFNRGAMETWLGHGGIEYVHMAGLGGRRRPAPDSPNSGWRDSAFRGYADYMATAEFRRALTDLEAAAGRSQTAIMCAEAVWWRCHRRMIADALVARGWRVEHLGVGDNRAVHGLPAFARVDAAGAVTYPPAQATLLEPRAIPPRPSWRLG